MIPVSVGQESRHGLVGFSAQGLTSLKSNCQLDLLSQLEAHLGKVLLLSSLRLLEEYFCVTVEVMAACFFTASHGERQSLAYIPSRHSFKRFT